MSFRTQPAVLRFVEPASGAASYLVTDPATRAAAVIDPVLGPDGSTAFAESLVDAAREHGSQIEWVFETQVQPPTRSAAAFVAQATGARVGRADGEDATAEVAADEAANEACLAQPKADGRIFMLGLLPVLVIPCPVASAECCRLRIGDAVFIGDMPSVLPPPHGEAWRVFPRHGEPVEAVDSSEQRA